VGPGSGFFPPGARWQAGLSAASIILTGGEGRPAARAGTFLRIYAPGPAPRARRESNRGAMTRSLLHSIPGWDTLGRLLAAVGGAALLLAAQTPVAPAPPRAAPAAVQIYGAGDSDALGPGDLLEVRVLDQPQLSGEARVASDGTLALPFLDRLEVGGETAAVLERRLQHAYARLLRDPVVSLRVLEVNSRHVTVSGSVPRPGVYAFSGALHLLEALAMAGGLDASRAGHTLYLLHAPPPVAHPAGADGRPLYTVNSVLETIDLDRLWRDPRLNRTLAPGDVIEVEPSDQVYIAGSVLKGGALALNSGLTLSEAVGAAGGLLPQADAAHVRLLRRAGTARRELVVDLGAILHHRRPDLPLEANDVVLVSASALRNVGLSVLDFFGGAGRWRIQRGLLHY